MTEKDLNMNDMLSHKKVSKEVLISFLSMLIAFLALGHSIISGNNSNNLAQSANTIAEIASNTAKNANEITLEQHEQNMAFQIEQRHFNEQRRLDRLIADAVSTHGSLMSRLHDNPLTQPSSSDPCAIPGPTNQFECYAGISAAYQVFEHNPKLIGPRNAATMVLEMSLNPTASPIGEECTLFANNFKSTCELVIKSNLFRSTFADKD